MDQPASRRRSSWTWPTDIPASQRRSGDYYTSFGDEGESQDNVEPETTDNAPENQVPPEPQPHYLPRTCRICLEIVYPSFDTISGTGLFGGRPRVKYVSEDPELGRLMSPCKCKGSQKYVHEGCLQAWRQSAPLSDRNFWRCPTCQFEYRLERLRWGRWISSRVLRAVLTLLILLLTVFLLGFVADPIINLWIDPLGAITDTVVDVFEDIEATHEPDAEEAGDWFDHFLKGFFSLGLLGFVKAFFALSPWQWWNLRTSGVVGGARRRGTGRDRLENVNIALVIIGVFTFIGAVWKGISMMTALALEKASERVVDVQTEEDDEAEEDQHAQDTPDPSAETRKDR